MLRKACGVAVGLIIAATLLSCGFGGGATPPAGNAPADGTASWSMPGGNSANTRLSPVNGPATPEVQWATLSEYGASSPAIVTPDGTVVIGAGNAVLAFNTDGSVRWRRPAVNIVPEVRVSTAGHVAFNFDREIVHVVSADGELLLEYELEGVDPKLVGVSGEGTLYTSTYFSGHEDSNLVLAVAADGELLWQYDMGSAVVSTRVLADGNLAYVREDLYDPMDESTLDESMFAVIDNQGQPVWETIYTNWYAQDFWQAENGDLYVMGKEASGGRRGYKVYNPAGELLEEVSLQTVENDGSFSGRPGITSEGHLVLHNYWQGDIVAFDSDGSLLWRHDTELRVFGVSFGNNGEVYVQYPMNSVGVFEYNMLGFDSGGELLFSLVYESNGHNDAVVDQLGRVCFGTHQGFYAYNPDGEIAWSYDRGGTIGSVAVGSDGTVYTTADNILVATSDAGLELWRYSADNPLGVVIAAPGGRVYTHTSNSILELTQQGELMRQLTFEDEETLGISLSSGGQLVAAGSTGLVRVFLPGLLLSWEYQAPTAVATRIAFGEDGTLYFGCRNQMLYAVDTTGVRRWGFAMQSSWINTPVVVGDSIYATSMEGGLFKIGADGKQIWHYQPEDYCYSSPSIGPDGTVYFGTDDYRSALPLDQNTFPLQTSQFGIVADDDLVLLDLNGSGKGLYAVSSEGALKWNLHCNNSINEEVAVDAAGYIYLSVRGQLFSLNPDGTERWRYRNYYHFNIAPVIGNDGSILLGTTNMLTAIGAGR